MLTIDDEEMARYLVRQCLPVPAFVVTEAATAEEGSNGPADWPDVIVLDSVMPGMDGRGALAELRQDPITAPAEEICGDDWGWTMRDDRFAILVADGLRHGLSAHEASATAVGDFQRLADESPSLLITEVRAALRPTRGAAVAMVEVDTGLGVANYCALATLAHQS